MGKPRRAVAASSPSRGDLIAANSQLQIEVQEQTDLAQAAGVKLQEIFGQLQATQRNLAQAEEQRTYLIGTCNRLLDRLVGTQLSHGIATIDGAASFVAAERRAIDQQLNAIEAKHHPVGGEAQAEAA